jgi:hypothetical protein
MGYAFDQAFSGLSWQSRQQPYIRRDLALCIFRLFDGGERAPMRLARLALANVTHPRHALTHAILFNPIGVPIPLGH